MLIYLTSFNNKYKINFTKFLGQEEFYNVNRNIKKCPSAQFIAGEKEKFWLIEYNDINILKKYYPDLVIVEEDTNTCLSVVPQHFEKEIPHLDEMKLSLFDYQLVGVSYLCANNRAILSDEMGLGKTPQYLSAIYVLFREKKIKHGLIVCPNSIKYQIQDEIDKFFDTDKYNFTSQLVDGPIKKRMKLYEEWETERPVITIVNYELLNNDIDIFKNLDFDILICDEAHRLKNATTITYKTIKLLSSKINILHLVTGTIFSKEPLNIFNMFSLLNKNILGSYNNFAKEFLIIGEKYGRKNCILEIKSYPKFHERIAPYILRRLKKEVASSLPALTITNRYIEMTSEQKRIDNILVEDFTAFSQRVKKSTKYDEEDNIVWQDPRGDALMGYLILRHCVADSLELLKMGSKKMTAKYAAMVKYPKKYVPSPKIKETIEICEEAISSNPKQKIVIFTQYERMQRLLNNELSKKFKTVCVNGMMSAKEKNENIVAFQKTDINILIGTNSINYGINLQQSNLCICVDQSWLPDVEDQRHGRIHRINTIFDQVNVINLVSLESIDENIIATLDNRREMGSKLIEKSENENNLLDQITTMLSGRIKRK